MLIISSWVGRLGNNVLQIIKAIYYAQVHGHSRIEFPTHNMLETRSICLSEIPDSKEPIRDIFYHGNCHNPTPIVMKKIFQQYISDIFRVKCLEGILGDNKIHFHIRGGDIFFTNPHPAYVQPPMSYYTKIMEVYDVTTLVCEDKQNPCISKLMELDDVEYVSETIIEDLSLLCNAKNVAVGYSSFGFLVYLINARMENFYIPLYFSEYLFGCSSVEEWSDEEFPTRVHIVRMPKYIKVGEWKNTVEQRQLMLSY